MFHQLSWTLDTHTLPPRCLVCTGLCTGLCTGPPSSCTCFTTHPPPQVFDVYKPGSRVSRSRRQYPTLACHLALCSGAPPRLQVGWAVWATHVASYVCAQLHGLHGISTSAAACPGVMLNLGHHGGQAHIFEWPQTLDCRYQWLHTCSNDAVSPCLPPLCSQELRQADSERLSETVPVKWVAVAGGIMTLYEIGPADIISVM